MEVSTEELGVSIPTVNQLSIVVPNLEDAMARYSRIFGIDAWRTFRLDEEIHTTPMGDPHEFVVTMALSADRTEDGLKLWRGSRTEIELAEPTAGTSLFSTALEEQGPGLHHLASWDLDYEATLERFEDAGYDIYQRSQVFGISEYCYVDTRAELDGCMLEIARGAEKPKPSPEESDNVRDVFITRA